MIRSLFDVLFIENKEGSFRSRTSNEYSSLPETILARKPSVVEAGLVVDRLARRLLALGANVSRCLPSRLWPVRIYHSRHHVAKASTDSFGMLGREFLAPSRNASLSALVIALMAVYIYHKVKSRTTRLQAPKSPLQLFPNLGVHLGLLSEEGRGAVHLHI